MRCGRCWVARTASSNEHTRQRPPDAHTCSAMRGGAAVREGGLQCWREGYSERGVAIRGKGQQLGRSCRGRGAAVGCDVKAAALAGSELPRIPTMALGTRQEALQLCAVKEWHC